MYTNSIYIFSLQKNLKPKNILTYDTYFIFILQIFLLKVIFQMLSNLPKVSMFQLKYLFFTVNFK